MAVLVRLSFWAPAARMADFAEEYDKRIRPVLDPYDLVKGTVCERPGVGGVFNRVFEIDAPSSVQLLGDRLRRSRDWQELLRSLGEEFGMDGGVTIPWKFAIYRAPAGPGRTVPVGPGYRQGLWLNFGVQDGLQAGAVQAIIPAGGSGGTVVGRHGQRIEPVRRPHLHYLSGR